MSSDAIPAPSLYVGDLAPDVNEALLFEIFNAVGPVASIRVCRDALTRRSLGYAYVNFHQLSDAERALDSMNFSLISGRPCRIMWSQRDPSLRKSGVGNVFVKNLERSIDHKTLYDTFSVFGNILSCKVSSDMEGRSLGYGFVHFETEESARKAIEKANGMEIAGQKVIVTEFKAKTERGSSKVIFTNLYVKNLPEHYTQEKLETLFGRYGSITSSMLAYDAEGNFKGFGFVNFENFEDASAAISELHEKDVEGKILFVGRAMKKSERLQVLKEAYEKRMSDLHNRTAGCNLYVKNLTETITEEKLRDEFSRFGTITSLRIQSEPNGKSKGFGFVCFSAPEEAQKALSELNGAMWDKKPLYVSFAQKKEIRRQQLEAQHKMRTISSYPPAGNIYYGAPGAFPKNPYMHMYPGAQPIPRQPPTRAPFPVVNPSSVARPIPVAAPGGIPTGAVRGRGGPRGGRGRGYKYPARREVSGEQLTLQELAAASPGDQKQMIGERLFPLIRALDNRRAGKITGMLLEMDNSDLLEILESQDALKEKVNEAIGVLEAHASV